VWVQVTIAIVAFLALVAIFIGLAFCGIEKMMRSSDVYKMALSRAQSSPCVTDKLGAPIAAKWMISGNISENNGGGSANFELPIYGPHGQGELDVSATRSGGAWTITSLSLIHDGGQIHLLPVPSPCE
jgi:hypothetical protein